MTEPTHDLDAEFAELTGGHESPPAANPPYLATVPIRQVNLPPGAEHGMHFTVVLSTTQNPVQPLLGRDYNRAEAVILACDEAVVIAQSREMAQSVNNANQASVGPVPSGAYLPTGIPVTIRHCDEVWVAATSATLGRVSVAVSLTGERPAHAGPAGA